MGNSEAIYKQALMLEPFERARLIDKLIASLDKPDREIDELWAGEAESRIDACDQDKIKSVSLERVLLKYGQKSG